MKEHNTSHHSLRTSCPSTFPPPFFVSCFNFRKLISSLIDCPFFLDLQVDGVGDRQLCKELVDIQSFLFSNVHHSSESDNLHCMH